MKKLFSFRTALGVLILQSLTACLSTSPISSGSAPHEIQELLGASGEAPSGSSHGEAPVHHYSSTGGSESFGLSDSDMLSFARLSSKREFDGDPNGVVMWNKHEGFLSLGIGHYLWGNSGKNGESFREMIRFTYDTGCYRGNFPSALSFHNGSIGRMPWRSKSDFEGQSNTPQVRELKSFLLGRDMQICQVKFQLNRLKDALATILRREQGDPEFLGYVRELLASREGVIAMLDYVNFKGEGLSGKGCGLFEVLRTAAHERTNGRAINRFKFAAVDVLSRRSDWRRYSAGWQKRIAGYGDGTNFI